MFVDSIYIIPLHILHYCVYFFSIAPYNPIDIYKIELETGDYNTMLEARSVEMFNNKDIKIESFKDCKGSTVKLKINDPAVVGIDKSGILIAAYTTYTWRRGFKQQQYD